MKVYLGSDHAGFRAKERIKAMLERMDVSYEDLGATKLDKNDDYPDYAFPVAAAVARSKGKARGVLVCGSGVGVDMVANRVRGARSVLATTSYMAQQGVQHDNANILSLAARVNTQRQMERFVKIFLAAKFSTAKRHQRRSDKITNYEKKWLKSYRPS